MARKKNVAQVIVDVLASVGVRRVYGVAGDSLNGLTDAIFSREDVSWIHVRHEEVGAFAAGAEAHLTGKLCVCAGSSGPGHLHLINGLYDCHRKPRSCGDRRAHTEPRARQRILPGNPSGTALCRLQSLLRSDLTPGQVPRLLEIAIQTEVAQSGVAVIVLPGEVALEQAERDTSRVHVS
jgi:pyruvate dehydrogenase (quinone)